MVVTVKETMKSAEEEVLLDVRVYKEGEIEGRMKPERIGLKSQRAGTGPEAPGHQRLSSWETRRTTAGGCSLANGSSDMGEIFPFKPLLEKKPIT